jgi:hypothetical protein
VDRITLSFLLYLKTALRSDRHGNKLKVLRDLPKCWMGYIMIDLLGKVRYFSNLKGFPPFADKHRFIRTQPIASNKWPALSPLLQRPCPPPPTSLRLKTMGRRRCGIKSSGKEAVWNSSPFEDHLPTLVELQYSGDVTDLRRYPQSTICKGWDRTSCRDQCPRGPSQGPPRDHRALALQRPGEERNEHGGWTHEHHVNYR